jgi:hypothetical protein
MEEEEHDELDEEVDEELDLQQETELDDFGQHFDFFPINILYKIIYYIYFFLGGKNNFFEVINFLYS